MNKIWINSGVITQRHRWTSAQTQSRNNCVYTWIWPDQSPNKIHQPFKLPFTLTCWVLHPADHLIGSSGSGHGRINVRTIWRVEESSIKSQILTHCKQNHWRVHEKCYHVIITPEVCEHVSFSCELYLIWDSKTLITTFDVCSQTPFLSFECQQCVCVCIHVRLCTYWSVWGR